MLVVSLALAVGGILLFWFVPTLQVYTAYPWPSYVVLALSVGAALRSTSRWRRKGPVVVLTGALLALFVAFTGYLPRLDRTPLALNVGDRFPDFTLTTSLRERFSPRDLYGKTPALYIFYRGDW